MMCIEWFGIAWEGDKRLAKFSSSMNTPPAASHTALKWLKPKLFAISGAVGMSETGDSSGCGEDYKRSITVSVARARFNV